MQAEISSLDVCTLAAYKLAQHLSRSLILRRRLENSKSYAARAGDTAYDLYKPVYRWRRGKAQPQDLSQEAP